MKTKSVTLLTLKKGNSRMCLSAKRALGQCFECENYNGRYTFLGGVKKCWRKPCESRIVNPQYDKLKAEKEKLYKAIENINKKIKEV